MHFQCIVVEFCPAGYPTLNYGHVVKSNPAFQHHFFQISVTDPIFTVPFDTARKTLAIHVYPDGTVIIDAPGSASNLEVTAKVKKRAAWIFKQKLQFESYPPTMPQRRYVSGETHRYLGRQYRLKVTEGKAEAVKLLRGQLSIETSAQENW